MVPLLYPIPFLTLFLFAFLTLLKGGLIFSATPGPSVTLIAFPLPLHYLSFLSLLVLPTPVFPHLYPNLVTFFPLPDLVVFVLLLCFVIPLPLFLSVFFILVVPSPLLLPFLYPLV